MKDKSLYYDKFIKKVPDFPRKGIIFYDITSLILNPTIYKECIEDLYNLYKEKNIDAIAAIDSRGYLFGAPLALKLSLPLVLIRKKGKLPREVIREEYALEYGTDTLEIHKADIKKGSSILIIDDILATGGTLTAATNLIEKAEGRVESIFCFIELKFLKARESLKNYDVQSFLSYS